MPSSTTPKPHPNMKTVKDLYKTKDKFTAPPVDPDTIWYLTINTPSTDSWSYHGPTKTFAALMPLIEAEIAASESKTAAEKWKKLLDDDEEEQRIQGEERETFGDAYVEMNKPRAKLSEVGIIRFVIPRVVEFRGEEGVHTILAVKREINPAVYRMLPASVYTVTCQGPIPTEHVLMSDFERNRQMEYQRASGLTPTPAAPRSTTSFIAGSYPSTAAMKTAAKGAMDRLLSGVEPWKVMRTEAWEESESERKARAKAKRRGEERAERKANAVGGVLMAMTPDARWEVKIKYEEDGLVGALERFEGDAGNPGKGKKVTWRLGGVGG
ncbi:hypothetical protein DM02DRAFT_434155 [Periconia macrospinosa]|uniref:Uncharacterized protein n=1 Tax=Periconia macrospinosa TaxID=97972 RepID=A0A2V1DML9_9PLEO|nr:hypothetical protein DM02DRAFT_434155 [Periconia macrospinosa]